jgi:hypothetical protein
MNKRLFWGARVAVVWLWAPLAQATVWYAYDHEAGDAGTSLPDSSSGPELYEYDPPGVFRQSPLATVGKFAEVQTANQQAAHLVTIQNGAGLYGQPWSESAPVTLVAGSTYYIAALFRFQRIGGNNIWQDTAAEFADQESSVDKMFEFQGANFRWGIGAGWMDTYANHCASAGSPCAGGFAFQIWYGPNSGLQCVDHNTYYEHFNHNVAPYGDSNPFRSEYERWYAVVLEVTANNSAMGRTRLWVNGTLVTDRTGFQTMCSTTGSTVTRIYLHGTIAQPAYDAPAHLRQWDEVLFTDSFSEVAVRGFFADPEGVPDTLAPAAPTSVIAQ